MEKNVSIKIIREAGGSSSSSFHGRYASLDSWRGIAAVWVMMHHTFGNVTEHQTVLHWSLGWLLEVAKWGWLGVPTFFVISGYCIASNVYRMRDSGRPGWAFLFDRFLRIYPTYWVAWLISILLCIVCAPFSNLPALSAVPTDPLKALANMLLIEPYLGMGKERVLLVAWTLWFEFGFYALVAIALSLKKLGISWKILLAFATAAALYGILAPVSGRGYFFAMCGGQPPPPMGYLFVFRYWGEFLYGVFVFLALLGRSKDREWGRVLLIASIGIGFAGLASWTGRDQVGILYALAFAGLLYVIYPYEGRLTSARCLKPIGVIGVFSYSLYLTHIPVSGRAVNILTRLVPETSAWYILVQAISWAVGLLVAWGIYHLCEKPMERFRKKIGKRIATKYEAFVLPVGAPSAKIASGSQ